MSNIRLVSIYSEEEGVRKELDLTLGDRPPFSVAILNLLKRKPEDLGLALSCVDWVRSVRAVRYGFVVEFVFENLEPIFATMRIA